MVKNRINALREKMKENGMDVYLIPTADFHESEYVAEYFMTRKYMSGFTGSAGTLVVTLDEAGLWTDGRYFIQAENQLKGSGIILYRMGQENVPTVNEFILEKVPQQGCLGFDGRVINAYLGETLKQMLTKKQAVIKSELDLVDDLWPDRPSMPNQKAFLLDEKYSGKSTKDKLAWLKQRMEQLQAEVHLMASLDDIAWLFNLRGFDVACTPVVIAYAMITRDSAVLYADGMKFNAEMITSLENSGVTLKPYELFFEDVKDLKDTAVLVDKTKLNYAAIQCLDHSNPLIFKTSPVVLAKAMKNSTEINNLKEAHLKDGAAVTQFIYWLKNNVGKMEINEVSAADQLEQYRREQGCIELSFNTICAYNANAAMMHYSATEKNHAVLKPEGMLLVDSGGQYMEGTTDITRTIALGPVSEEWKKYNTTVLKGMLNLSKARFLYGCTGMNLDILARGPVWQLNIDYQCGTGHGVGYLLGVHEGPQGIHFRNRGLAGVTPLEEGMIITNEPGIYNEGECGIRIENELVVCKGEKNFYGQFMHLETLTFAPIDRDLIDPALLNEEELTALNHYHQEVYAKIAPRLSKECAAWLYEVTLPIEK